MKISDDELRAGRLIDLFSFEWSKPDFESSVTIRGDALVRLQIGRLTASDLRFLVGQGIGLEFILPCVLELLLQEPLKQAEHYPGDLLLAVLNLPASFWVQHEALYYEFNTLPICILPKLKTIEEACQRWAASATPADLQR